MGLLHAPSGSSSALIGTDAAKLAARASRKVWVESPLRKTELDVYWTPRTAYANRPKGYNVYRGLTPNYPLGDPHIIKLNTSLLTVPIYRDLTVDITRRTVYWYLVTEVFNDNSENPIDKPTAIEDPLTTDARRFKNISPQRIYKEFRRRKHLIQKWTAEKVDLLIERTAGDRCCKCFNPQYESMSKGDCPECYGTSFEGGYEIITEIDARILTPQELLKVQPAGLQFVNNPVGWIVDFPLMRNGDVIVRKNGFRYEIDKVQLTIHQGVITEQNFDLIELETSAPVYAFAIPPTGTV